MRKRGGKPAGPFHVQIVKGKRMSNDLANRLNDYKHQFPTREIVAVNVLTTGEISAHLCDELAPEPPIIYEVVWSADK